MSTATLEMPDAISCYFDAVANGDLEAYVNCFTPDAEIVVVSRHFKGANAIRRFGANEVIGGQYELIRVLDPQPRPNGFTMLIQFTPEGWSSPEPRAVYDFDYRDGRITRANFQYAR